MTSLDSGDKEIILSQPSFAETATCLSRFSLPFFKNKNPDVSQAQKYLAARVVM